MRYLGYKFRETGSKIEVTGGLKEGRNGEFNDYRVYVWDDENFLKMDTGDGCTTL